MAQKDLSFPLLCLWKNGEDDGRPLIALNSDQLNEFIDNATNISGYSISDVIAFDLEFYEVSAGMKLTRVHLIPPPKIVKWGKK